MPLVRPTADTGVLVASALAGLRTIYRRGLRYAQAGVMMVELQPQEQHQHQHELDLELDDPTGTGRDRTSLMTAIDRVNQRYGRGSVMVASSAASSPGRAMRLPRNWQTKHERRTPRYTTRWDELPLARA